MSFPRICPGKSPYLDTYHPPTLHQILITGSSSYFLIHLRTGPETSKKPRRPWVNMACWKLQGVLHMMFPARNLHGSSNISQPWAMFDDTQSSELWHGFLSFCRVQETRTYPGQTVLLSHLHQENVLVNWGHLLIHRGDLINNIPSHHSLTIGVMQGEARQRTACGGSDALKALEGQLFGNLV